VATFAGFFVSVLLVFVLSAVDNIRKDPEAMKKLKGIS
jgi:capsular polysaccharide biosynthesis protein